MKARMAAGLVGVMASIYLLTQWLWLHDQGPFLNPGSMQEHEEGPFVGPAQTPITPIPNSKHFMVSAFKDHRLRGTIRVISILCREGLKQLYCVLCAKTNPNATTEGALHLCVSLKAKFVIHNNTFNYSTASVLCQHPLLLGATHVSITTKPTDMYDLKFLKIQNQEVNKKSFKYNFTLCISNIFGKLNNALQFVQTMELNKIIGVQRVVIYNTSCGPEMEKALQYYRKEGLLEVVPWPIDKFLKPSDSWRPDYSPGDIHYYGQVTTLNDCIYRYMYQSKYLLLNDMDEIIMPYQHANLGELMSSLQKEYFKASVFKIRNYVFPNTVRWPDGQFPFPEWQKVPGVNLLEHLYREPDNEDSGISTKLIVDPRGVGQTLVHDTQKWLGDVVNVPSDVCRLIHVRHPKKHVPKDQLIVDKKLWEFEQTLIPNINRALHESGLLT